MRFANIGCCYSSHPSFITTYNRKDYTLSLKKEDNRHVWNRHIWNKNRSPRGVVESKPPPVVSGVAI